MQKVQVIGTGLEYADLTPRHLEIISQARILVGGREQLDWFPDHPGEKLEIKSPVQQVVDSIQAWMQDKQVVVLATGDPLFYGIGTTLIRDLGRENVDIHPNVSVMARAFSRIKKSWEDASWISLHGRNTRELLPTLALRKPLFVFTDSRNSPDQIARVVEQQAPGLWQMCVLECLGRPEERIRWLSLEQAGRESFQEPNSLILCPEQDSGFQSGAPTLGGPDEDYLHESGIITKPEVRAVTLSKLDLKPEHVFWDLGAGSGAVAVEASLFVTRGRILAVEKNPERLEHIQKNAQRFKAFQVETLLLELPRGMEDLPDPDRIFVGGGGRDLPEILRQATSRLKPDGRIVMNLVVLETLNQALDTLHELGMSTQTIQVQINQGSEIPGGTRFQAKNPVFVVSAEFQ